MLLWTHPLEWFPRFKQRVFNLLYQYLAQYDYQDWTFMNYGYAESFELPLWAEDQADRYCCQLYDKVVSGVSLNDKTILEVGCGRGGGLSFLQRYHGPAESHGVDRCQQAIQFCRWRHDHNPSSKLRFKCGDALDLSCADATYDVVVNVESSHCYPSRKAFFDEAYRVLKPGGKFCYADLHEAGERERISQWLSAAGFVTDACEDITRGVLDALQLDNARKQQLIDQKSP
jgi:ubiquinone/menaquinone biosynthesis C-methylase UbiE